jgi:hypothetical protein
MPSQAVSPRCVLVIGSRCASFGVLVSVFFVSVLRRDVLRRGVRCSGVRCSGVRCSGDGDWLGRSGIGCGAAVRVAVAPAAVNASSEMRYPSSMAIWSDHLSMACYGRISTAFRTTKSHFGYAPERFRGHFPVRFLVRFPGRRGDPDPGAFIRLPVDLSRCHRGTPPIFRAANLRAVDFSRTRTSYRRSFRRGRMPRVCGFSGVWLLGRVASPRRGSAWAVAVRTRVPVDGLDLVFQPVRRPTDRPPHAVLTRSGSHPIRPGGPSTAPCRTPSRRCRPRRTRPRPAPRGGHPARAVRCSACAPRSSAAAR